MGSHRASRRDVRRRDSSTTTTSTTPAAGGRRAARSVATETVGPGTPGAPVTLEQLRRDALAATALAPRSPASADRGVQHTDVTVELPLAAARSAHPTPVALPAGRRRATHTGPRGSLFKGLPSAPVLLGVTALAFSVGGTVLAQQPELASADTHSVRAASALSGTSATGAVDSLRGGVSRDSSRGALAQAGEGELVAAAEEQAVQRDEALGQLAAQAQKQADKLAENRWVLPLSSYRLTAEFGDYGLWATYHTGLDFAAPTGSPIMAVANGTVTSTAYDGAYGNKTVVTLEDGTELWYCHQTTQEVSTGDTVTAGQVIGTVGSTGNVTGPHLHLEVRPGGGDPVDPYEALVVNGVTP